MYILLLCLDVSAVSGSHVDHLSVSVAICPQGCWNGGSCVAPGICSCPDGWIGGACHTGWWRHKDLYTRLFNCSRNRFLLCSYYMMFYGVVGVQIEKIPLLSAAVCKKRCMNGGKCVSPDTCRCRAPFSGPQCEERKKLFWCQNSVWPHWSLKLVLKLLVCLLNLNWTCVKCDVFSTLTLYINDIMTFVLWSSVFKITVEFPLAYTTTN